MPIKQAAFKALRQNKKAAERNKKVKSDIEALTKRIRKAITAGDKTKGAEWLAQAVKKIDKAVQKKMLKKNTASRQKSRLAIAVNKIKK